MVQVIFFYNSDEIFTHKRYISPWSYLQNRLYILRILVMALQSPD